MVFNSFDEGGEFTERFWFSDLVIGHISRRGYRILSEERFNEILRGKFDTENPLSWLEHINSQEGIRGKETEKEYSLSRALDIHDIENYDGALRILSVVKHTN